MNTSAHKLEISFKLNKKNYNLKKENLKIKYSDCIWMSSHILMDVKAHGEAKASSRWCKMWKGGKKGA